MNSNLVKLVFFVPTTHSDVVRRAMGDAGAGQLGEYSHCSFSSTGTGRFIPGKNAQPHVGAIGILEEVEEERVETLCEKEKVKLVVEAIKHVHPYEEVAFDIIPLLSLEEL